MDNSISNEQIANSNDTQTRQMKDSGVEWIGKVPCDWSIVRFKDYYKNKKEIAGEHSAEYERLALTLNGVIKRPKDDSEGLQPKEFDTYQILRENDFVFKMIDLQNISTSRVGLSPYTGLVSPAYIRFTSRTENQFNRFTYYYLMSMYYNCVFNSLGGDGVRSALNASDMGTLMIPFPDISEQQTIAAYLDRKCTQIDTLIANQQQQIEKLKAYKQSVITETVTKGLDPDMPMKDSGVEWIGEIPVSWSILKAAFVYDKIGDIDHYMPDSVLDGIPYIMTGDLKPIASQINFEICKQVSTKDFKSLSKKISANNGDIIFARYATIGTVCYVDIEKDFLVSYSCLIIKPNHSVLGKFLYYYYQSHTFFEEVKRVINSNTQSNVGLDAMTKVKVICPSIEEQQQIADYLDQKCEQIDRLITIKQQKIEKIQQYKKSLIYEYVTGKKEVI